MKILVATNHLFCLSGSEITATTIAEHLVRQGHEVVLHARYRSADFVRTIRDRDVEIIEELEDAPSDAFDAAYTQHHTTALAVRSHFPRLPILHASLGVLPDLEQPPSLDLGISSFLALSEEVRDNLVASGVRAEKVTIFRNIVDSRKFHPFSPVSRLPRRALVLSYKIDESRLTLIKTACARLGIEVSRTPERPGELAQEQIIPLINEADIVFSLGRGVIEAMMCGRVPFVLDYLGGDGLVTPDNVMSLGECNFSGRKYRREYDLDGLIEEIKGYRSESGAELRSIAIREFDASNCVLRLADMLDKARASFTYRSSEAQPAVELVARLTSVNRRFARMERDLDMMGLERALLRGKEYAVQEAQQQAQRQARKQEAFLSAELTKAVLVIKAQAKERERLQSELAGAEQKVSLLEKEWLQCQHNTVERESR